MLTQSELHDTALNAINKGDFDLLERTLIMGLDPNLREELYSGSGLIQVTYSLFEQILYSISLEKNTAAEYKAISLLKSMGYDTFVVKEGMPELILDVARRLDLKIDFR